MQLREALRTGLRTLVEDDVPSSQLAAELLLMHVLGCDRGYLYTHHDTELPPDVVERYTALIAERATGKPTQYITGHQEFWGLDFEVTHDVLIPRPETEHVVEAVLELVARSSNESARSAELRIADVGTGSGCIALALASQLPRATIFATDISWSALSVASRNAVRLGMAGRVRFVQTDLLACFLDSHGGRPQHDRSPSGTDGSNRSLDFDFIVSNPPYVGSDEIDSVQREVREFEPRLAWGGLERGEEVYRRLIPQALALLKPGGYLVLEIGYNMQDRVRVLFDPKWTGVEVCPDLAGIPRVVIARKAA